MIAQAQDLAAAPGVVGIDLDAVKRNWKRLAGIVEPARCGAVVKADAYGLGAAQVIPALLAAGCRVFFVATAREAAEVRTFSTEASIFALDGLMPGAGPALLAAGAIPVLSSLPEIAEWAELASSQGFPLPCALHIDTGLVRLGLSAQEVQRLANDGHALARLDVRLVMSHLACADDPAAEKNAQQLAVFQQLRPLLPSAPASLAASDGLMLGPAYHFDLVRPGYALYGGQAFRGGPTPVEPVVSVKARILQVRDIAPGATIGYGATYRAVRQMRIATLSAGYADGFFRHASAGFDDAGGVVAIGGRLAPVVGRVSMDLITVDVTELPEGSAERGGLADLVGGAGPTLEEVGRRAGTIGYEVLTRLSHRFHRSYAGGTEPA